MSANKESKYKLIGHDYQTPDLIAKVRGQSKYAEDFRVDGMVFAKLALSPAPHARIRHIDGGKALAMPGVLAILTADELPVVKPSGSCPTTPSWPRARSSRSTPANRSSPSRPSMKRPPLKPSRR